MRNKTLAILVFVLLCAVCIVHAFYYYPRLPEQVARHFGPSGQPDAWGSKLEFLIVYLSTVGVMAATFLILGMAIPRIPNWAINLPNKDYWLAPERRKKTLDHILPQLFWFGSITMIFLLDIFHQAFQVQLGKTKTLGHVWITMGFYLLAAAVWCVVTYRKFSKKSSQPE